MCAPLTRSGSAGAPILSAPHPLTRDRHACQHLHALAIMANTGRHTGGRGGATVAPLSHLSGEGPDGGSLLASPVLSPVRARHARWRSRADTAFPAASRVHSTGTPARQQPGSITPGCSVGRLPAHKAQAGSQSISERHHLPVLKGQRR